MIDNGKNFMIQMGFGSRVAKVCKKHLKPGATVHDFCESYTTKIMNKFGKICKKVVGKMCYVKFWGGKDDSWRKDCKVRIILWSHIKCEFGDASEIPT